MAHNLLQHIVTGDLAGGASLEQVEVKKATPCWGRLHSSCSQEAMASWVMRAPRRGASGCGGACCCCSGIVACSRRGARTAHAQAAGNGGEARQGGAEEGG